MSSNRCLSGGNLEISKAILKWTGHCMQKSSSQSILIAMTDISVRAVIKLTLVGFTPFQHQAQLDSSSKQKFVVVGNTQCSLKTAVKITNARTVVSYQKGELSEIKSSIQSAQQVIKPQSIYAKF